MRPSPSPRLLAAWAIGCGLALLPGCCSTDSVVRPIPSRMLSHRSRSLMIAGWNKRQVHDQYGFTYKRLRSDFETYLDELPDSKISVDEILVYAPYDLQQISIYFWNSKVVFAVHCWSDW